MASVPGLFLCTSAAFANNLNLNVTGQVTTAYDDNITDVEKDRLEDFVTNLETGLELEQKGETHDYSIKGDLIEQIFAAHGNFNNLAEDFNVSLKQALSEHDRVAVVDIFKNSTSPSNFQDTFGRSNGLYSTVNNQVGVSYTHDLNEQLSSELHFGNVINNYSQNNLVSSALYQGGGTITYTHDSANIFNLGYDYIRRLFASGPGATINSILTGFRHYFTSQIYTDIDAGPDFINTYTDKNIIEPHYKASVTDQIDQNNSVGLTFEKEVTSDPYDQDLFNSWRTSLNLFRQFSVRLSGNMNVFYGQGRYDHLNLNEDLTGIQTQVNYALTQKTQLSVGYTYTNSASNSIGNAFRKNYFYVIFSFKF